MYIGRLDPETHAVTCAVCKKDTMTAPAMVRAGNPLCGEPVEISYKELWETGVDIHVKLPAEYRINEAVLCLDPKTAPKSIKVYTAGKKEELYRYLAETGKSIRATKVALLVEADVNEFVIEISTEFTDVLIERLDIYGADFSGICIYPVPVKCLTLHNPDMDGRDLRGDDKNARLIPVSGLKTYSFDSGAGEQAGKILKEKLEEITGTVLTRADKADVRFVTNMDIAANGYNLSVNDENTNDENGSGMAVIEASDLRGMVYGAETLLKLALGGGLSACRIEDAPRMEFRGVHLMLPAPDEFGFAKRLIKYVLSPMGYNTIIMEIAGAMEFESHPEINRAVEEAVAKEKKGEWPPFPHNLTDGKTVKKELVADLVDYARSFGIDVIPEVQSLGHVQFLLLAHPELAEYPAEEETEEAVDERLADVPPDKFYKHSYCPSNPKTYEILFDLIDEAIEVFRPREYVHMGHDEVYQIGICPKCKDKDPAELFAADVNKIYQYLKKKGLKMMMWGDMLQPVTKYKTPPAIDMIPKDIVLLDFIWYFHMDLDIEDNLLKKGFPVIIGNMYSSHFPRYESRIVKDGIIGAQISSWVATREDVMAREGKIYDILYSAQMMWSESYTGHARYSYDRMINKMMPYLRQELGNREYPSLKEGSREIVAADQGEYKPGKSACGGTFTLGCRADSLVIEHTATAKLTRIPWIALDKIGEYEVKYTDGSSEYIPVTYAGNVSCWNRRHNEPFKGKYYRHNGYSATYFTDGTEEYVPGEGILTMYRYEWINPKPEAEMESIRYIPDEEYPVNVYVGRILAYCDKSIDGA